jgi:steroid 5-alpha reductase family enzyme
MWWSIYGLAFSSLNGWQNLAIISPIYITLLLLFGSGIPTLEKTYAKRYGQAWEKYRNKTSLIIPWFQSS